MKWWITASAGVMLRMYVRNGVTSCSEKERSAWSRELSPDSHSIVRFR